MDEAVTKTEKTECKHENLAAMIATLFALPERDIRTYSPLTLAYLGDAVFDLIIRTFLVENGNTSVNRLNKRANEYVSAVNQSVLCACIEPLLTEPEAEYLARGRNAKYNTKAKNSSPDEYHTATGLECLIGYLYLTKQTERLLWLMKSGMEQM